MRVLICLVAVAALAGSASASPLLPRPATLPGPVRQADAHLGEAANDTDFLFRLGMLEGHLMVGHELLSADQTALALPHFGHPVRELYDDIGPYLDQHHFPPSIGSSSRSKLP